MVIGLLKHNEHNWSICVDLKMFETLEAYIPKIVNHPVVTHKQMSLLKLFTKELNTDYKCFQLVIDVFLEP